MSGVHGERRGLAHAAGGLLGGGGGGAHQVVQRRSALDERVQRFLHTRVVKIDARSGRGEPLPPRWDLHASRRGAVTLGRARGGARHGLAGRDLDGGRAESGVRLGLGGGGRASGARRRGPAAAVEQAEDRS